MTNRISIVIPGYNESNCIGRGVAEIDEQFEAVSEDCEIIVVDDGSNDTIGACGPRSSIDMRTRLA